MKIRITIAVLAFFILVIIAEVIVYKELESMSMEAKAQHEKLKQEVFDTVKMHKLEETKTKVYGYAEIVDILNKDSNFNITSIKSKDESNNSAIVQIELNAEESNVENILSQIYSLDNLQEIGSVSIKGSDPAMKHIILRGEFLIK